MTYSDYIKVLRKLIKTMNVKIIPFSSKLRKQNEKRKMFYVSGRSVYTKREIHLDEPLAEQALMTLAHEGGHFWAYDSYHTEFNLNRKTREYLADEYGWILLEMINAPITKDKFEQEI